MNIQPDPALDLATMTAHPAIRKLISMADDAVRGTLEADFPVDRLFGAELSAVISRGGSLQKRHGNLLQHGIVAALRASGRFTVLTNQDVLITGAAISVAASTPPEAAARLHLRYDSPAERTVNVDVIAIDEEAGWAGAYDCKRGGGQLTQRLLRPIMRDLKALRLLLRAHLRDRGYPRVDEVAVGIIDIYGGSGVSDDLAVTGEHLDGLFGVPVSPVLDLLTTRMADRFERGMAASLVPLVEAIKAKPATDEPSMSPAQTRADGDRVLPLPARLNGPRRRTNG